MPYCCYGLCKSDSRKPEAGVTFIPFPKPTKEHLLIAKRWVHLCARSNLTIKNITRNTYICSKHFPEGEVLNIRKNPTLEPFNARKQFKEKAKARRRRNVQQTVIETSNSDPLLNKKKTYSRLNTSQLTIDEIPMEIEQITESCEIAQSVKHTSSTDTASETESR